MAVTPADTQFRKAFLLLLVGGLTIGLIVLLRAFLLTILVTAVMSGLIYPLYARILTIREPVYGAQHPVVGEALVAVL